MSRLLLSYLLSILRSLITCDYSNARSRYYTSTITSLQFNHRYHPRGVPRGISLQTLARSVPGRVPGLACTTTLLNVTRVYGCEGGTTHKSSYKIALYTLMHLIADTKVGSRFPCACARNGNERSAARTPQFEIGGNRDESTFMYDIDDAPCARASSRARIVESNNR